MNRSRLFSVAFAAACSAALVTVGTASADTPNDKADDAYVECVNEWSSFRLKTIGDVAPQHEMSTGGK